jgi:hypothetical protein
MRKKENPQKENPSNNEVKGEGICQYWKKVVSKGDVL